MAQKGVGGGFIPHLGVVLYPRPIDEGPLLEVDVAAVEQHCVHRTDEEILRL